MKTLDEVIEIASDWTNGFDEMSIEKQMLHYLKEYKRVQYKIEKIALGNIEDTLDKIDNPAMTWDELRTMEGKPVWIEESAENGLWWTYWVIWQDENAVLPKEKYGTEWQAYRKERE